MKYCLLFLFGIFVNFTFGQSDSASTEKINEAFGENYAENLAISNPGKLDVLKKYANTGFIVLNGNIKTKNVVVIKDIPLREKGSSMSIDEFVNILLNESYNPLFFAWLPGVTPAIYKLDSTDYHICIPSQKQLERI